MESSKEYPPYHISNKAIDIPIDEPNTPEPYENHQRSPEAEKRRRDMYDRVKAVVEGRFPPNGTVEEPQPLHIYQEEPDDKRKTNKNRDQSAA